MKNRTRDSRSKTRKPACPMLSKLSTGAKVGSHDRQSAAGDRRLTIDDHSGMVLLVVVLILAIILVLGAAALTLATGAKRMVIMQDHRTQAYYIADAGVERALAMLRANPDAAGELLANVSYPDAGSEGVITRVYVEVATNQPAFGKRVQITSEGHFRGVGAEGHAQEKLAVNVRVASVADLLGGISILPPEPIDLKIEDSSASILGTGDNLILNGNLTLEGGTSVTADVYVSGTVCTFLGTIYGGYIENYPFIPPFPVFDENWLQTNAKQVFLNDTTIALEINATGDTEATFTFNSTTNTITLADGGIYFIDGNVTIFGEYSVPAIIVATGDIEIGSGVQGLKREASGCDLLITLIALGSKNGAAAPHGDVSIKVMPIEALIIAHGALTPDGDATVFGGIIAQGLGDRVSAGSNSFELDYSLTIDVPCRTSIIKPSIEPSLGSSPPPTSLIIESWKETKA